MKKFASGIIFFLLIFAQPAFTELFAQSLSGRWEGAVVHGGSKYRMFFTIEEQDNKWKASLDVPDQGARGIPVQEITVKDDSLSLVISSIGASYKGKIRQDNEVIQGRWNQAGFSLPLDLQKTEGETALLRPQLPEKPYPYHSEEITFRNTKAGVSLSGTFSRPKSEGQHPAVILVSGSGPQDRDGTLLDHKPFLVLADHLTRNGFAVLRYDDRGFGKSSGNFTSATTQDFANDAIAAFNYLQNRSDVKASETGIIGHSEGGIIAPLVAEEKPLAFLVLLAPPVLPGRQTLLLQGESMLKKQGGTEAELQNYRQLQNQLMDIIRLEPDTKKAGEQLKVILQAEYDSLPEEIRKANPVSPAGISAQVAQLVSPWFRYFVSYNPAASLAKVNAPVLVLFGGKDLQVPAKENAEALEEIIKRNNKTNFEIAIQEGLNHLFQPADTGLPIEYNQIETTMDPEVLRKISNWIQQHTEGFEK